MARIQPLVTAAGAAIGLLIACQTAAQSPTPQTPIPAQADARRLSAAWPAGYLPATPLPDSLLLSPPPPSAGSPAEARDIESSRQALALRGTARWAQARRDADLFTPGAANPLSCAAGIAIGPQTTPKLDLLLRRAMVNLAVSTSAIKQRFRRERPFMANHQPTCTPEHEPVLRTDGSYPSGHSAVGFGWSLILAELVPDRAARIVARGRDFGDSRRICNAHWLSDIEEGRIAAAAMVARLNAEPAFRADLDAAWQELRDHHPAPRDCAAESTLPVTPQ